MGQSSDCVGEGEALSVVGGGKSGVGRGRLDDIATDPLTLWGDRFHGDLVGRL
jgi:hypothetical protein